MLIAPSALAQTVVKVGAFDFPPYYNVTTGDGVTADLLDFLNKTQNTYEFKLLPTSPRRRYSDIASGRFHIMFFEMPEWGWGRRSISVEATPSLLTGGEVYVTRAGHGRDQSFFDDIKSRTLSGITGYHYGFADFNSDPDFLRSNFDIHLTSTHDGNLRSILAGRSEVAVVTKAYLKLWQQRNPTTDDRLLVSDKLDQVYQLPILVGPVSPVEASDLWEMIVNIDADHALRRFFQERGLGSLIAF